MPLFDGRGRESSLSSHRFIVGHDDLSMPTLQDEIRDQMRQELLNLAWGDQSPFP